MMLRRAFFSKIFKVASGEMEKQLHVQAVKTENRSSPLTILRIYIPLFLILDVLDGKRCNSLRQPISQLLIDFVSLHVLDLDCDVFNGGGVNRIVGAADVNERGLQGVVFCKREFDLRVKGDGNISCKQINENPKREQNKQRSEHYHQGSFGSELVCSDIMFYFLHRSNERRNAERET
jgi:hypothetical protein